MVTSSHITRKVVYSNPRVRPQQAFLTKDCTCSSLQTLHFSDLPNARKTAHAHVSKHWTLATCQMPKASNYSIKISFPTPFIRKKTAPHRRLQSTKERATCVRRLGLPQLTCFLYHPAMFSSPTSVLLSSLQKHNSPFQPCAVVCD